MRHDDGTGRVPDRQPENVAGEGHTAREPSDGNPLHEHQMPSRVDPEHEQVFDFAADREIAKHNVRVLAAVDPWIGGRFERSCMLPATSELKSGGDATSGAKSDAFDREQLSRAHQAECFQPVILHESRCQVSGRVLRATASDQQREQLALTERGRTQGAKAFS